MEAGLSPAIEVLPEDDAERLFRIAVDEVVNKHKVKLEPVAERLGHDGSGNARRKQPDWQSE